MRKYLLPEHGNFYKVNMHSHSTLSDGKQTPEELSLPHIHPGGGCQLLSCLQFSRSLQPALDEITVRTYPF